MHEAVRVEGLVKRFGTVTAVDGISFYVERGEIFGILGPNGAGKTTTLEIIEGLLKPTAGAVSVLGVDVLKRPAQVKARIGVLLQSSAYYDHLNLGEILSLLGSFYANSVRPAALLEQVGLSDRCDSRVNHLSGGQKQRFALAASLVNAPELVVLDEPTTGLDPQARRNLWAMVRDMNGRGITVVLTTHYMEEAEALCHRVGIMDRGKLLTVDTPSAMVGRLDAAYTVKMVVANPLTDTQIASLNGGVEVVQSAGGSSYLLRLRNTPRALETVLEEIAVNDISLEHLEVTPVTLEDVFLELTGNELRD